MDWDEKAQTNKQTKEQTIRSTYTHITRAKIRKRMYVFITIYPIIPMGILMFIDCGFFEKGFLSRLEQNLQKK